MRETIRGLRITRGSGRVRREVLPGSCGIKFEGVASAAERRISSAWIKNSEVAHSRFLVGPSGVMTFDIRNVVKAPIKKQTMETSVVSQAYGFAGKPAVERPRMTVLPVCMPTNMPQFLKLAASTMPETRQQARRGKSPWSFVMGPRRLRRDQKEVWFGRGCFSGSSAVVVSGRFSWALLSGACGEGVEWAARGIVGGGGRTGRKECLPAP